MGALRRALRFPGCSLRLAALLLASSSAQAIDCSQVAAASTSLVVCRGQVSKDELRVFLNDANGQPLRTFAALERMLDAQGKRVTFAMNAGMFHANLAPVGLLIDQRREVAPLNTANGTGNFFMKPNGVFFVRPDAAAVIESSKFPAARGDTVLATQSGPLLVSAGKFHSKLSPTSTSRFLRNGIGVDASGTIVFAVTEGAVTLYELASVFRDVLKCPNALYLDGTVTSVYAPALNKNIQRADLGPILAVVEPRPSVP